MTIVAFFMIRNYLLKAKRLNHQMNGEKSSQTPTPSQDTIKEE